MTIRISSLSLAACAAIISGCASRTPTMQNIQGSYCYDVASYTGTTFHLENGKFTSHYFTDVVLPHRRKKKPEVPGRYTLNGQRLTVVWPRGVRWTPKIGPGAKL